MGVGKGKDGVETGRGLPSYRVIRREGARWGAGLRVWAREGVVRRGSWEEGKVGR